jgi:hypothetical protein
LDFANGFLDGFGEVIFAGKPISAIVVPDLEQIGYWRVPARDLLQADVAGSEDKQMNKPSGPST